MEHRVLDPAGNVYATHRLSGPCLDAAVRKFSPQTQPGARREVWLQMKAHGYRIERVADSAGEKP